MKHAVLQLYNCFSHSASRPNFVRGQISPTGSRPAGPDLAFKKKGGGTLPDPPLAGRYAVREQSNFNLLPTGLVMNVLLYVKSSCRRKCRV